MKTLLAAALFVMSFCAISTVQAQERKIDRKALPPGVEQTVARESAGATIKGFSTEKENGKWTYEAELMVDGLSRDISMDKNGNILEVEQQVSMDSLPDNVKTALNARAGAGTLGKIESLTKGGKLVAYEAVITNGGKRREVQVGPNGEKLSKEQ
jgi:hypothetical protein